MSTLRLVPSITTSATEPMRHARPSQAKSGGFRGWGQ